MCILLVFLTFVFYDAWFRKCKIRENILLICLENPNRSDKVPAFYGNWEFIYSSQKARHRFVVSQNNSGCTLLIFH